ncbi:Protein of unknown function (DUF3154) [uncultured Mediterranean phage uvMED]|mgnify:FL=1|nr:Protein of unknown function (DUF3154) [uncultured Mediterranean phage uvMED]BAR16804.1 Protein of unknown function (DUF3154) [uncultured Mediterranean phage uvMED]BAR16831.1 Protein of unknown function (DUF3154) [uncultured Mediterranean phage uvMED]BAR16895.1 Protein of unknown function (DUF3154) [uncultured Mediterranean phage uvMED]BAR16930.1 Protein of unknown function (DUF3154) [uncultured Mediterranean phage uvMED]
MIQALIPAIAELAGGWIKGKAEQKAAESKAKVAKAEAEAEVMKVTATHEAGWEKIMAQGTVHSLKDEWLVLLFSIPLILAFCGEWGRQIVSDGFAALNTMPEWYQYSLGVIVASSFAIRGATRFFKK